jgi:hypothetical protein
VEGRLVALSSTTIAAPVTTTAAGVIEVRSSPVGGNVTLTVSNGFTNTGTIELIANTAGYTTTLGVTTGTLVNAAGAVIRSLPGTGDGARTLAAAVDNRGSFDLQFPLTVNRAGAAHLNSGTIALTSQNLTYALGANGSLVNTGTITLAAGRTLTVSGGTGATLNLSGGTLTGDDATLSTSDLSLTLTPTSARTRFDFNTGTTLAAAYTVPATDSLRLIGGTLNGPGLAVEGRLVALSSTTIAAPVTTTAASVIEVRSSPVGGNVTLTMATGFTNAGTIELIANVAAYTTTIAVTTGTLVNGATGVIRSLAGTGGGGRTILAAVDNQGTIAVTPGSASSLTINGSLLTSGALNVDIGGPSAGSAYDVINVTGPVTLGGTLNINLFNAFTPSAGQSFTVVSGASRTGTFASIPATPGIAGATYTATGVTLNGG